VQPYTIFLLCSGFVFSGAERLWPRRGQALMRRSYGLDLVYMLFNAEVVGALVAIWLTGLIPPAGIVALRQPLHLDGIGAWPPWAQLAGLFFVKDFFQW
jgi:hypothetical protein